jgi:pimeloyl-ACP methyl ester carboxylesterase
LTQVAATVQRHRIRVEDGVELAYAEGGAGEPVVLMPGWTMSAEVFEHQIAGLAPAFRVIAIDPRCHGRSSDTATGNDYPQHGRDLAAVLHQLDLHDVNLVGWSYGALGCYACAEQFGTERLRSLTVIDQSPKPLRTGLEGEWAEDDLDGFLTEFVGPVVADPDGFAAGFVEWALDREPTAEEREWVSAMHLRTPRHAAECLLVSAMFSDYRELAASLSTEIAVANVVSQQELAEAEPWLSCHLPNAALWTMPSHLGFWDHPDEFTRRLREFLDTGR